VKPPAAEDRISGLSVKYLFMSGRAVGTLLLWVPYFMNLLLFYFILSWLPALLREVGMPVSAGIAAVTIFSFGNVVGASIQGRAMTMFGAARTLLTEFVVTVVLIGVLGMILTSYSLMLVTTLAIGICVPGAQAGLNALAALFYPTAIRSTGVGWALGVGRVGSIVGPVIGGMMLSRGWTPQQIFEAGIAPAVFAATAIVISSALPSRASAFRPRIPGGDKQRSSETA
jgi:AAHS family 4-hydroxybenzoate transporter-like MFS transporter